MALVEVLTAIGIKPDFIIGHSLGENSCAYADGCLTLEQSVLASYARGVASKEVQTVKGMMAAIGNLSPFFNRLLICLYLIVPFKY